MRPGPSPCPPRTFEQQLVTVTSPVVTSVEQPLALPGTRQRVPLRRLGP